MATKKKKNETDGCHGEVAWETAEVKGGTLVVEIDGEVSGAWRERVGDIVDRLSRSPHWGKITVGKGKLTIEDVTEGHESDLRHVLEGAIQQANADFAPEPEDDDEDGEISGADGAMTEAFRAFAPADDGDRGREDMR